MGILELIFIFLTLLEYASADDAYHNHAAWFVGNTTAPPPTVIPPTTPNKTKVGTVVLVNRCAYPVYIWEAWDTHQAFKKKLDGREKETYKIIDSHDLPGGGKCIDNCGVTYKLSKTDSLVGGVGGNQVQFEYSTRKGLFYYDLSFVDCAKDIDYRKGNAERCPGWDAGLKIVGKKACKEMYCGEGKMCIYDGQGAYYIDQPVQKWGLGEPVGTCPDYDEGTEIGFVLCTSAPPLVKE